MPRNKVRRKRMTERTTEKAGLSPQTMITLLCLIPECLHIHLSACQLHTEELEDARSSDFRENYVQRNRKN